MQLVNVRAERIESTPGVISHTHAESARENIRIIALKWRSQAYTTYFIARETKKYTKFVQYLKVQWSPCITRYRGYNIFFLMYIVTTNFIYNFSMHL